MLQFDDALRTVLDAAHLRQPVETVPLVLAAGRTLAEPIVAGENIPPAANSSMDGYTVLAADTAGATEAMPVTLRVIGEAAAGMPFERSVEPGMAVRVMTGGLIPDGADTVVEVEATSEENDMVSIRRVVEPGHAVRPAGEDVREGESVLAPGKLLTPGDIALLAALGVVNVPVRVRPIVGILSTGAELVPPHATPPFGGIRNSTGPALYAAVADAGGEPIDLGIVGDDREELAERIEEGLRYDVLITTGGVSVGAHDLVRETLEEQGVEIRVHGVGIKPGKPFLFGVHGGADTNSVGGFVFGLPGNPVSTLVTFQLFVRPAIAGLMGAGGVERVFSAIAAEDIPKNDAKRHFVRAILNATDAGEQEVRTTGIQSSGAVSSMGRANCLVVLPETSRGVRTGERVEVMLL